MKSTRIVTTLVETSKNNSYWEITIKKKKTLPTTGEKINNSEVIYCH